MKRKSIYSLIVTIILMGSLIPLQTQAAPDALEWHSSLTIGTEVVWRITEQSLFDPAVPPSLAGEDIWLGNVLSYEINDTLPDYYDDVYSTSGPPNFFKLYVDNIEVSLYDVDENTEPALAIQYMILPIIYYDAADGANNITQFLEHRAALDPNITSISYAMTGGNYVRVSIFNDFIDSFIITVNNDTGIVADFFIEDDFGEMYGQLDIWESSLDDSAVPIENTLNWHPNLDAGTVLSWVVTDLTLDPLQEDPIMMAEQEVALDGIFKFEYPNPFDIDPWDYYNPNSYFNVFYEEEPVRWENITRAQLIVWLTLTTAPNLTLYNSTVLSMPEILEFRGLLDPVIISTSVTFLHGAPILEDDLEDGEGGWRVHYEIHPDSGIVASLTIDIHDVVNMELEFLESQSSLLINGSVNPDYIPYEPPARTMPGFNWFYFVIPAIIILPILRKRKK